MSKPKIIKSFNKLDLQLQTEIVNSYPRGFDKFLITFKGLKGKLISALPFETEDHYYFVKMTREEAISIYTGETFNLEEATADLKKQKSKRKVKDAVPKEA